MPASLAKRCITFCETVEYRNVISGNSLGNAARKDNDLDETAHYAPMQKGMFLWLKPPSDVSPIDVGFDAPLWLGRLTNDEPPERSTPRPTDKFDVEFWGPFKNNCLSNDLLGTVRSRTRKPHLLCPALSQLTSSRLPQYYPICTGFHTVKTKAAEFRRYHPFPHPRGDCMHKECVLKGHGVYTGQVERAQVQVFTHPTRTLTKKNRLLQQVGSDVVSKIAQALVEAGVELPANMVGKVKSSNGKKVAVKGERLWEVAAAAAARLICDTEAEAPLCAACDPE